MFAGRSAVPRRRVHGRAAWRGATHCQLRLLRRILAGVGSLFRLPRPHGQLMPRACNAAQAVTRRAALRVNGTPPAGLTLTRAGAVPTSLVSLSALSMPASAPSLRAVFAAQRSSHHFTHKSSSRISAWPYRYRDARPRAVAKFPNSPKTQMGEIMIIN